MSNKEIHNFLFLLPPVSFSVYLYPLYLRLRGQSLIMLSNQNSVHYPMKTSKVHIFVTHFNIAHYKTRDSTRVDICFITAPADWHQVKELFFLTIHWLLNMMSHIWFAYYFEDIHLYFSLWKCLCVCMYMPQSSYFSPTLKWAFLSRYFPGVYLFRGSPTMAPCTWGGATLCTSSI